VSAAMPHKSSLTVLDLSNCSGFDVWANEFEDIITNFVELTEANFSNTSLSAQNISFLCNHLTIKIEKLSLGNLNLDITDDNIKSLVSRCKKIKELDLHRTIISCHGIQSIIENLSNTLTKLTLAGFDQDWWGSIFRHCKGLQSMPKLSHLWLYVYPEDVWVSIADCYIVL
jgi:hypothetical protein